jgi:uncharacterized membrane protein
MPDHDDCPNQPEMLEEVELNTPESKHSAAWRYLRDMDTSLVSETEQNSVEIRIGLYWLHKMGIACLVFGFAFLIMYSFQFLGPQLKLMIGCAVSAVLIVFGERMARNENQKWFGQGLIAGGWSLGYFTAYAAYFVPSVHLISSLVFETLLLMAVAAGALISALRARSEVMSILFATATILISGLGPF